MHRLAVLYPPPPDPDAFRDYYLNTHLPLAAKLPGMRRYTYAFDIASPAGESPYFCIFEADFDSAETMSAAMASPEGEATAADVPNYAPPGVVMISYDVIDGD
ncbi:MAG: EthD family reductase [Solirubrobacteraceae bacterium]